MPDESTDNSNATEPNPDRWLLPALAIASLRDDVPERRMLTAWLDSWSGAREVIDAMNGHGYDVRLSQSPFGWWAEFCRSRVEALRPASSRRWPVSISHWARPHRRERRWSTS
jgi:hypothetical protein